MQRGADIEKAIALFKAGNAAAAAQAARAALRRDGRNVMALYLLALAQMQDRKFEEAERQFAKATAIDPTVAEIWANRGNNQIALGRPGPALEFISRALALAPDFPEAHYNQAKLLAEAGRLAEALAAYDRCLALVPRFADAMNNRGVILAKLGRREEALASYDRCLAVAPRAADTLNNRGNLLAAMGRHAEALASFDASLAAAPAADTLTNRGNLLAALRRPMEALASYDAALRLTPDTAALLERRGHVLAALGRDDDAAASFERALAVAPDNAAASLGLVRLLIGRKRLAEAGGVIGRLLAVAPHSDFARGHLAFVKLSRCDWNGLAEVIATLRDEINSAQAVTLPFHGVLTLASPQEQLACATARVAYEFPPGSVPRMAPHGATHDRIRLAYVSADFHEHATAYLLAGLIEHHDRSRFETIGISFGPDDGSATARRIRTAFERFHDVGGLSDPAAAALIRELEVDIAVDLKGFTADCRPGILAPHPAALQVAYLGFPGTMGADFIDYVIADRRVIPREERHCYAEQVVYLPDSYQCTDDTRAIAATAPSRAEAGLPAQGVVFCAFNHTFKITPEVFDVWMRLLTKIDGSVLWQLGDHPDARENLRREAERRGVAAERIVFADRVPQAAHLARHRLADLFLDTLPCCAHTTASDALWAGLPVLTCSGTTFAGRVAASLLDALGLPELIMPSLADYEAAALRLAADPAALAALKAKVAAHRETHPLFDTARFCRGIEAAYDEMHARARRGEAPAGFSVPSPES